MVIRIRSTVTWGRRPISWNSAKSLFFWKFSFTILISWFNCTLLVKPWVCQKWCVQTPRSAQGSIFSLRPQIYIHAVECHRVHMGRWSKSSWSHQIGPAPKKIMRKFETNAWRHVHEKHFQLFWNDSSCSKGHNMTSKAVGKKTSKKGLSSPQRKMSERD